MTKTVGIVLGTTRDGRFSEHPARWIQALAATRRGWATEIVDLRDYPMPFFSEEQPPALRTPTDEAAARWCQRVAALDGYVFVLGEYNRSLPAVLKNALDHAYHEFHRKPAGFIGYGGTGGVRAIEHLRSICIELQLIPTRNAVHIGLDAYLAVRNEGRELSSFKHLDRAAGSMLDELEGWFATLIPSSDPCAP